MSTLAKVVCALALLLVLATQAFARESESQVNQVQQPPLVNEGPNAGLSNEELVSIALDNVAKLKSYGFGLVGIEPAGAISPTSVFTLTGYEQPPGSALTLSARGESSPANTYSLVAIFADESAQMPHEMIVVGGHAYFSADQGKTWQEPASGSYFVPPVVALCTWSPLGTMAPCADLAGSWALRDADPRTEIIDGTPTRHLVADLSTPPKDPSRHINTPMITKDQIDEASLHLWVSTDATPLVRRMRFDAASTKTVGEGVISPFLAVAFSPDGKLLAGVQMGASSRDPSKIVLWDLSTPSSPPTNLSLEDPRETLWNAAFSPDGKVLAAIGSQEVYLWDTSNLSAPPRVLPIPGTPGDVPAMAFSPDGKLLGVTGSKDGVYLWDAPFDGSAQLAMSQTAGALAFSPDGRTLATSGSGGLRLYSLNDLKAAPRTLEPAPGGSGDRWLAFSPDGQLLASGWQEGGGQDQSGLRVWDLRNTQQPVASFPGASMVAFSPDGKLLAAAGGRIWEVSRLLSEGSKASPITPRGMCGNDIAFSPDGSKLAVACYEPNVQLWSLSGFPTLGEPALLRSDPATADKITYSLTWSWGRFNEQFPQIVAPAGMSGPTTTPPVPVPTATSVSGSEPPLGMPGTGSATSGREVLAAIALVVGLLIVGMLLRKVRV